jgi:uncharacterized protein (DUF2235 family)
MSKRIILLSDGTGNAAARVWRSNVWRLFESLDLTKPDQVAIYDDGVGTASFRPLALLGGAFGWGLKRNVIELYTFLCRNYEPGAQIYGFGFSRGAFTMRILAGLVVNQGVVKAEAATGEVDLQRLGRAAYRKYRAERFHTILRVEGPFRWLRDRRVALADWVRGRKPYDPKKNIDTPIRFLGLWDTVAAYGLPIDEMTRGVSQWLFPLEFPNRELSHKVLRACHALALDDERTTFHPMLWTEAGETSPRAGDGIRKVEDERLSQVWFAGMHANVGGGYPDDRLAHVPLVWIMRQAELCGVKFKKGPESEPDAIRHAVSAADRDGRLYDSRQGLAGYYRYGPRKIAELCAPHYAPVVGLLTRLFRLDRQWAERLFFRKDVVEIAEPKIHMSVIERMKNGAFAYAPIGFPSRYAVVDYDGQILAGEKNLLEHPAEAETRAAAQEHVWNWVWGRRLAYFLTLFASFNLALFPVLYEVRKSTEFDSPLPIVSKLVRIVGGFLPGFAGWWIDAFAAKPMAFLISVIVAAALILAGVYLGARASDGMRSTWNTVRARRAQPDKASSFPFRPPPTDLLFRLRTTNGYRSVFWFLKRGLLPVLSVLLILYLGASMLNRLAFNVADGAGLYCQETPEDRRTKLAVDERRTVPGFDTGQVCWPSGVWLEERGRYELALHRDTPWVDGYDTGTRIESHVDGFEVSELESRPLRWKMFTTMPIRRNVWQPWFRPIARIGARGTDEYPLDPEGRATVREPEHKGGPPPKRSEITMPIRPRRSGELFLYVNDALIGVPPYEAFLYRNNRGTATLTVKRLR